MKYYRSQLSERFLSLNSDIAGDITNRYLVITVREGLYLCDLQQEPSENWT